MDAQIVRLAEEYRSRYRQTGSVKENLRRLYEEYVKRRQQAVLDAAAAAGAVYALFQADHIDTSKITPQMEEAFRLAFPGKDISSLHEYSPEQLEGIVSAWKGKYFEVLVRDKLNSGEWVGNIHLEPGQVAVLADSPTQPGWDLQILNPDGSVAHELQAKATESLSYVKEALEKYPDIQVIVTDEALQNGADALGGVMGSEISDDAITEQIIEPMESLFGTTWENLCETVLPILPFVLIIGSEGRAYLVGKKSAEQALSSAIERSIKSGAAIGVGAIVALLDGGLLSVPASMLTRLGIERYQILSKTGQRLEQRVRAIRALPARCV